MLTVLQAVGLNKWVMYALVGLTVLASIGGIVLTLKKSGANAEKAKQIQAGLSRMQKEALERARIESMRTTDARKRLLERWSAR